MYVKLPYRRAIILPKPITENFIGDLVAHDQYWKAGGIFDVNCTTWGLFKAGGVWDYI